MAHTPHRRPVRGLLTAGATVLATLLTAGTAHADLSEDELESITDKYLFEISLDEFTSVRAERPHDEQLVWASDACSWSPDEPLGYEFTTSCYRHDFGYRNYQEQDRFTEPNRLAVDNNFKADMYSTCDDDAACETVANIYYFAVRQFGGSGTGVGEALDKARVTREVAPSGRVVAYHAVNAEGRTVEFPVPR